jgi:hypothetical protein
MTPQLISTLTPSISTFLCGLSSYRAGITPSNLVFANFVSRVDLLGPRTADGLASYRSGQLYHAYKLFVHDCCVLASTTGKRAFEVVNDVPISL